MSKILWLTPPSFNAKHKGILQKYQKRAGLDTGSIYYVSLHYKVKKLWVKAKKKDGTDKKDDWCANPNKIGEARKVLDSLVKVYQPSMIIINDAATLEVITQEYNSLDLCRGSVYLYKGIVCHVCDDILKVFKLRRGPWVLLFDLRKFARWHKGNQRNEPKFIHRVCHDLSHIDDAVNYLNSCAFISIDIETTGNFMSCVGYCGLRSDGTILTYVIPLFNPTKPANAHWPDEETEAYVWKKMAEINNNSVCKIFQNGSYDCAYFIRFGIPVRNYFIDPMHLWHSIYAEAPKRINFIASIALDYCRYWKDEAKGDNQDKVKTLRVPVDAEGLERYWRYNGLDCHNTLLAARFILLMITQPVMKWALDNYVTEFESQMGPALAMSMRGMCTNKERQAYKNLEWMKEHKQNLKDLKIMCDDEEFNPKSSSQVASLIYDVLGAPLITFGKAKGKRSADEKVLKFIRLQHPLYAAYIDKIWAVKKPANNASKYGGAGLTFMNRFLYNLSAAGTDTARYSGSSHQFWCGTNPQNVPKTARDMFVADPGYVIVDADYAQSDAWFVAYESQDDNYMRNISDERDTHSVHAAHFFKKDYEEIYQAHLRKEAWVEDPIKGVRQNTKRVAHGANYRMKATTLYQTMGHEAVVASAKALGHADAHTWSAFRLIEFCKPLLKAYYTMYPDLEPWFDSSVTEAVKNGNRATCAFGRTRLFLGNMASDAAIQRELSAYYGQGGTAGNINRTLLDVYYETDLEERGLMLLTQTHDSITFQVPLDNFMELTKEFLTIMEGQTTLHGRSFTVPVDAEIGLSWGEALHSFNDEVTVEQLLEVEREWQEKKYG